MGLGAGLRGWLRRWFPKKTLGRRGEDAAARFLRRRGYRIVARGDRQGPGELDIVALDGRTVVFVEVKTRLEGEHAHAADAVTPDKQRRLSRLGLAFLRRHGLLGHLARFDVVAVAWPERGRPEIEHLKNAFEAVDQESFFS